MMGLYNELVTNMRNAHPRHLVENYNHANLRTTPQVKPRQSTCAGQVCFNHQEKVATHTLNHPETHQQLFYCEKCSIMLASKGHNIIKLGRNSSNGRRTPQPYKSERQREIEHFLNDLSFHIEEINKRYEYTQTLLVNSQEHFSLITQEITAYFKQIEDILQIQKFMSYNAILNHRAAVEAEVRGLREAMHGEIEELIGVGNDIQNNMEAVEMVELHIYESIMDNYREKVELAREYLQVELQDLPAPTLVFPDIPKMLYSLADKINLKSQIPQNEPNLFPKPSLSNRSNLSRNQSCENSRAKPTNAQRSRKCLSNLANIKNAESIDDKQIVFSFEQNNDDNFIHKALFNNKMNREIFHPQEMVFRESLSLTEIRQNQEECQTQGYRRYTNLLQETIPIPEQAMTSQESLNGYFAANTLNYSLRDANQRNQETETLLIC